MKKGELTRQHIIAMAAPVFNQRGFAGCSMQDLMDATGLEKGGLYRHFKSKEELAVESYKYALRQVIEARLGDLEDITGALPRLKHVVKAFAQVPSPIPGGCPLMNTAADADTSSKAILKLAAEALQQWKLRISEVLSQGIKSGEIRPGIVPRRIANTIISTLEGALMMSRLERNREAVLDAKASLEALIDSLAA